LTTAKIFLIVLLLHTVTICFSQLQVDSLFEKIDPQKWSALIGKKAEKLEEKIIAKSQKTLNRLQKQEEKIYRKMLRGKDSLMAKVSLAEIKNKYKTLQDKTGSSSITTAARQYIPKLDTLTTALKFLDQKGASGKVKDALSKTESLQNRFQQAEEIKEFIRERRQQLKTQLEKLGLVKQLKKFNKQAYYYTAQVQEYKEVLRDSKKAESKAIELLSRTKLFQDFMKRNSMLASFFPMPAGPNGQAGQSTGFAALQTRMQVNNFMQQASFGNNNSMPRLQQNIQDAQGQVNQLRNKIEQLTGSNGSDLDMPDFKPNSQKTKSFLKRLEYGTTVQSQKSNRFFPATSDVGLSVGYKLNDKSVIGVAATYKIGWGTGWNNIKLTNEGVGLRSFVDWKLKGTFWISGGYEQNYRTAFQSIDQLKNLDAWQQSGLLGLTKTISLKSKFFKKTKLQFLWDFLSYRQKPQTQPLLFRVGYNF
jgi:hypothetical protein